MGSPPMISSKIGGMILVFKSLILVYYKSYIYHSDVIVAAM